MIDYLIKYKNWILSALFLVDLCFWIYIAIWINKNDQSVTLALVVIGFPVILAHFVIAGIGCSNKNKYVILFILLLSVALLCFSGSFLDGSF